RWRTQQRHLLLQGEVAQVIAAVQALGRGRNSKAIRTQASYFIKNQSRMAYAKLLAMKLPIGSGAIESTVRRVVNLRLKGTSLFWCRASAEAILLLRSYYKAGRWNRLSRCIGEILYASPAVLVSEEVVAPYGHAPRRR